jgi:cell division septation protein DedD
MKYALAILISIAGFAFAADPKTNTSTQPDTSELRRLESVKWDLKTHTLTWVIQTGKQQNGEFVTTSSQQYQITPDDATMDVSADKRAIAQDEAAVLHRLLDTLSMYCAQSVVWWEDGTSTPTQGNEPATKPAPVKPAKSLPLGVAEIAAHPQSAPQKVAANR